MYPVHNLCVLRTPVYPLCAPSIPGRRLLAPSRRLPNSPRCPGNECPPGHFARKCGKDFGGKKSVGPFVSVTHWSTCIFNIPPPRTSCEQARVSQQRGSNGGSGSADGDSRSRGTNKDRATQLVPIIRGVGTSKRAPPNPKAIIARAQSIPCKCIRKFEGPGSGIDLARLRRERKGAKGSERERKGAKGAKGSERERNLGFCVPFLNT